jgi:hypothetical protein
MNRNSAAYGRAGKGESVGYFHGHVDSISTLASSAFSLGNFLLVSERCASKPARLGLPVCPAAIQVSFLL